MCSLVNSILVQDDELAQEIRTLRFLVLDEADRMIEAGHFAELENILRLTLRESQYVLTFESMTLQLKIHFCSGTIKFLTMGVIIATVWLRRMGKEMNCKHLSSLQH